MIPNISNLLQTNFEVNKFNYKGSNIARQDSCEQFSIAGENHGCLMLRTQLALVLENCFKFYDSTQKVATH